MKSKPDTDKGARLLITFWNSMRGQAPAEPVPCSPLEQYAQNQYLVEEAQAGQSRGDFVSKISIASKEARETSYWLRLLRDSETLDEADVQSLLLESDAIINILTAIVKSTNQSNPKFKIQNSKLPSI